MNGEYLQASSCLGVTVLLLMNGLHTKLAAAAAAAGALATTGALAS
jgi:hypothetical protein